MSRGLQAEETAPERAKPDPERPESALAPSSASIEDQRLNTGGYRVSLPMFEGPLDLLLHLVQKHELDILNIPIAFITERYVEYIQLLDELNIDLASEYLVMAATLVHIKSRMLLPNAPEDESADGLEEDELDPRAELVRRLLEYQKYKLAAEQLGGRAVLGRDVFPRGSSDELAGGEAPLEAIASFKLLDAFQAVLERTQKTRDHQIDFERFSLSDKISELSELLHRHRRLVFHEMFSERASRAELIITFLALLEMTRLRLTRLRQDGPLEPIYIELTVADGELPPEDELPPEAVITAEEARSDAPAGEEPAPSDGAVTGEVAASIDDALADAPAGDEPVSTDDAAGMDEAVASEAPAPSEAPALSEDTLTGEEVPATDDALAVETANIESDAVAGGHPFIEGAPEIGAVRDAAADMASSSAEHPAGEMAASNEPMEVAGPAAALEPAAHGIASPSLHSVSIDGDRAPVQATALGAAVSPETTPALPMDETAAAPLSAPPLWDAAIEQEGSASDELAQPPAATAGAVERSREAEEPADADDPGALALDAFHAPAVTVDPTAEEPGAASDRDQQGGNEDSRPIGSAADAAADAHAAPEALAPAAAETEARLAADPREYE